MKVHWKLLLWILGLLLGFNPTLSFAQLAQKPILRANRPEFIANEVLIRYKANTNITMKQQAIHGIGISSKKLKGGTHQVKLMTGGDVQKIIAILKQDPAVESAQPNYIYYIDSVPLDTNYDQLWGLKNTAQTITNAVYSPATGTAGSDMGLEAAWTTKTDCSTVIVAVVDTGISYTHEDLAQNMWGAAPHGISYVAGAATPMDDHGHGTHVAGTIGARGNNSKGSTGICWIAKLMAVKVMSSKGSGYTSDIMQGVDYAVANGAKVINLSLGSMWSDLLFYLSIVRAKEAGVLVVAAAGNGGRDGVGDDNDSWPAMYPASFDLPNIISVAALDQNYERASFSNYGAVSVDVGAPGVNISSSDFELQTTISDPLITWNQSPAGSWTSVAGPTGANGLMNKDYGTHYAANSTDQAYQTYTLPAGSTAVKVFLNISYNFELDKDYFEMNSIASASNPFAGGAQMISISGDTEGSYLSGTVSAPNCIANSTCTIGMRLNTDANVTAANGVWIDGFQLIYSMPSNISYSLKNGTSMAAPHVAGLAALVWAQEPSYTYDDVKASILDGGVPNASLNGKTVSGNAASASGNGTLGTGAFDRVRTPHHITATYL